MSRPHHLGWDRLSRPALTVRPASNHVRVSWLDLPDAPMSAATIKKNPRTKVPLGWRLAIVFGLVFAVCLSLSASFLP